MQLIYRGHLYAYTATNAKPDRQARAINWRYRLLGAAQSEISPVLSIVSRSVLPRAINWRYQIPMGV